MSGLFSRFFTQLRRGFTLIEILIVVVIIGVLAAALLPYASTTKMRARDTARLFSMNTIAEALELYASSNRGRYPVAPLRFESSEKRQLVADTSNLILLADSGNEGNLHGSNVGEIAIFIEDYIRNIPTDPREGLTVPDKYGECEVDSKGGKHFAYYTDEIGLRYAITSIKESKRGNTHNCRGFVNAEGKGDFEVVGNGLYYLNQEGMKVDAEPPFRKDYIPPEPKDPTPPDPIDPGEDPGEGRELPAVDNGCFVFRNGTIEGYLEEESDGTPCPTDNITIPYSLLGDDGKSANVINIGFEAFAGKQIQSITINAELTSIGGSAFKDNELAELTLPNTITTLGASAFENNQLTALTLSTGLDTISASAFKNNYLNSLSIPTSVTTIKDSAFYGNELEQLHLPSSVKQADETIVQANGPTNNSKSLDGTGPHAFTKETNQTWNLVERNWIKDGVYARDYEFDTTTCIEGENPIERICLENNIPIEDSSKCNHIAKPDPAPIQTCVDPMSIVLEVDITEANQTITINKYFDVANYKVDRGDGTTSTVGSSVLKTYTNIGTYQVELQLPASASRWKFKQGNTGLVPINGTTADNVKIKSMPSLADGFGNNATSPGSWYFYRFNYRGAISSLPENSFNTSNITTSSVYFFGYFNYYGKLSSLPENSFNISNLSNVGNYFFYAFNFNGDLLSLPEGSFNISHLTQAPNNFFESFNSDGALVSLPEGSFDTSNISSVGVYFFASFNSYGALTELPEGSFNISNITELGHSFFYVFNGHGALTKLPEGSFDTSNIGGGVESNFFTSFNGNDGKLSSLPEGSFDISNITSAGNGFFNSFNENGALTELPEGSFDTSNISSVGTHFFSSFNKGSSNNYGKLTSLPEGSFDTSNISSVGNYFFDGFNNYGRLTSLPEGSFNTSNISEIGTYFFSSFNSYGDLTSLPEGSLDTSNISNVGNYFFFLFNRNGALTKLPDNSFNTSNISDIGTHFFYAFNRGGELESLPEGSFNISNITSAGSNFFNYFNYSAYKISCIPAGSFVGPASGEIGLSANIPNEICGQPRDPMSIVLEVTTTASNQKLKLNKYFDVANYQVDWGDGTNDTISASLTKEYTNAGTYEVELKLPANDNRWKFKEANLPLVPKDGTTANNVKIIAMPSLVDGFGNSASTPGDEFFRAFNRDGKLSSLPDGSFDTSHITKADGRFFHGFNFNGDLTTLPNNSFNFSNLSGIVGLAPFHSFNRNGELTSLPNNSFNISNITQVGDSAFFGFNQDGALTSLPDNSFKTNNMSRAGTQSFKHFNSNGQIEALPAGSFNISGMSRGTMSFQTFNAQGGKITCKPLNSFTPLPNATGLPSARCNY